MHKHSHQEDEIPHNMRVKVPPVIMDSNDLGGTAPLIYVFIQTAVFRVSVLELEGISYEDHKHGVKGKDNPELPGGPGEGQETPGEHQEGIDEGQDTPVE